MATTGFFEESPGVKSSTRLLGMLLVSGCLVLTAVAAVVALQHQTATVAALSTPIGALAGGAWGALRERNTE